jgi:hypothetical protein
MIEEHEIEQRKWKELEDALILAQTPISINSVTILETCDMLSPPRQLTLRL